MANNETEPRHDYKNGALLSGTPEQRLVDAMIMHATLLIAELHDVRRYVDDNELKSVALENAKKLAEGIVSCTYRWGVGDPLNNDEDGNFVANDYDEDGNYLYCKKDGTVEKSPFNWEYAHSRLNKP
jgi:hypothetical protein